MFHKINKTGKAHKHKNTEGKGRHHQNQVLPVFKRMVNSQCPVNFSSAQHMGVFDFSIIFRVAAYRRERGNSRRLFGW